jgi:hypothetical protein
MDDKLTGSSSSLLPWYLLHIPADRLLCYSFLFCAATAYWLTMDACLRLARPTAFPCGACIPAHSASQYAAFLPAAVLPTCSLLARCLPSMAVFAIRRHPVCSNKDARLLFY